MDGGEKICAFHWEHILCPSASLHPLHSPLVKKQNDSGMHFPVGEEECLHDSLPAWLQHPEFSGHVKKRKYHRKGYVG